MGGVHARNARQVVEYHVQKAVVEQLLKFFAEISINIVAWVLSFLHSFIVEMECVR